ncbi:hypothetical protein [Streptomyces sp. NPDC003395]
MRMTKPKVFIGSAAVVLAVLGGTAPAQAAPASVAAAGGTAPACIDRSDVTNMPDGGIAGYIYNNCGKTMRVKVIVRYWQDTSCQSIPNKQSRYFHTVGGRYDRTAVCGHLQRLPVERRQGEHRRLPPRPAACTTPWRPRSTG